MTEIRRPLQVSVEAKANLETHHRRLLPRTNHLKECFQSKRNWLFSKNSLGLNYYSLFLFRLERIVVKFLLSLQILYVRNLGLYQIAQDLEAQSFGIGAILCKTRYHKRPCDSSSKDMLLSLIESV